MNDKLQCTLDDVRVEMISVAFVNDFGQPIFDDEIVDTAGIHDTLEPYRCIGPCGQDFSDWQDVLDHLTAKEVA